MKCPHCGHWNKASLPRCFQCGEPLPKEPDYMKAQAPDWQHALEDEGKSKVYIQVSEDGEEKSLSDDREQLAKEMVELKARKARGEKQQKRLREESARRGYAPSSLTVKTNTTRETFFTLKDDPQTTLRPMPPELVEKEDEEKQEEPLGNTLPVHTAHTRRVASDSLPEEGFAPGTPSASEWVPPSGKNKESNQVYDGFNDTRAYEPLWDEEYTGSYSQSNVYSKRYSMPKRTSRRRFMRILIALITLSAVGLAVFLGLSVWHEQQQKQYLSQQPTIVASIVDDLAAHTITIPGQDGTQIYVRELHSSYLVSGGVAVLEIPDHVWYDNYEDYLQETMDVTLTPFLKTNSGQQKPMDPISYQIEIPLSPIELITPDTDRVEVSTAMYAMKFRVREDSTVTINGNDYSDLVNQEGGDVTFNATVQPIGENKVTIKVRSQYCRENTMEIILYRAVQEVPLDLVADQSNTSTDKKLKINATTIPGAIVNVSTPHTDLDITNVDTDGTFSFYAVFDQIGINNVIITAEYPQRKLSTLNFQVSYVPNVDDYTKVAWGMDARNYADLLTNNAQRVKSTQIYVCTGPITEIVSTKPQLAIMNTGTEESPQYVMLENSTKTSWEVGSSYKIFADAFGMYNDMPRLVARYTYKQ